MPFTLADAVAVFDDAYDPALVEPWDAVGLACGDPDAPVRKVLFAVDPVTPVVEEALSWGADLVVTHHPLLLRGVHGVPMTTVKGRVVHRLIAGGTALFTAHTNADRARPGVSDALARTIGLTGELRPILPVPGAPDLGLGRIGALPGPVSLRIFADQVAGALPDTAHGVRVAGDPAAVVRDVAVSGGAGGGLLGAVRDARGDAFLTADLRHHPVSESREDAGVALLDAAHWATEWPWLTDAARRLEQVAGAQENGGVDPRIPTLATDAWTFNARQRVGSTP